ncbi:MAG: hypothetical protein H7330_00215, partial [Hymenobacteraceae bacterium]|nr:hypothetical protein [Hymenobacteraceae bacterium]
TVSRAEEPSASYEQGAEITVVGATLLTPVGLAAAAEPANGSDYTLAELYALIECHRVEVVPLGRSGGILIIDEEGCFAPVRQRNRLAEGIWWGRVPAATGTPLFGRAIWCHTSQFR